MSPCWKKIFPFLDSCETYDKKRGNVDDNAVELFSNFYLKSFSLATFLFIFQNEITWFSFSCHECQANVCTLIKYFWNCLVKRWLADKRKKFREMDIFENSQKFCETNFYKDELISRNIFHLLLFAQKSLNESYHSIFLGTWTYHKWFPNIFRILVSIWFWWSLFMFIFSNWEYQNKPISFQATSQSIWGIIENEKCDLKPSFCPLIIQNVIIRCIVIL